MSSSNSTNHDSSSTPSKHRSCGKGGHWSGFNIGAMVLGFIFFWPLGLALLFWILSGRNVKDLPGTIREQWSRVSGSWGGSSPAYAGASGNMVFNEYQEAQYDRIREIKEEIKGRASRFGVFRENAKRKADEDEFNRFMNDNPGGAEVR